MTSLLHFVRRAGQRRASRRRGTVLILALGVLAILSVAALSYVTIVRLDRASVAASTQRGSYRAQADTVVQYVRDVVVADIFGNKIVTPDVPLIVGSNRFWPSMFEDSDSRDANTIDLTTFNTTLGPLGAPSLNALLNPALGELANPDDAFLASTEPRWNQASINDTYRWPQITNLNSAYRYDRGDPLNVSDDHWVRGDGRFVDLAEWFLRPRNSYADPSINLKDWTNIPPARQLGPLQGVNQDVYDKQINNMSEGSTPTYGAIRPSDERQWVDTDGDLRPDARWTTLDALNGQAGLKWVVAARIVDASALVNINSAIEFGGLNDYSNINYLGDGATPADIDVARLFKDSVVAAGGSSPIYAYQVHDDRLFQNEVAFNHHLMEGLGMGRIIEDTNLAVTPNIGPFNTWLPTGPSTPNHRKRYWEYFGQSPSRPDPLGRRGGGYAVRELVDLAAFWGVNQPGIVSRIEQHIDGTENDGYLPNDTGTDFGPLRSKEVPSDIRHLVTDAEASIYDAKPSAMQVKESARRLITPVSGTGRQSPVPVISADPSYRGSFRLDKVKVSLPPSDPQRFVRDAFQSLVWALAPSVTDRPLNRAAQMAGSGSGYAVQTEDAHYGGLFPDPTFQSPARHLYPRDTDINGDGTIDVMGPPLATFAVLTAASMSVNLLDAMDASPGNPESPTVISLYNSFFPPTTGAYGSIPIGTRLAQGDIPETSLPWITPGTPPIDPGDPYLIVGVDRQPFLREVTTVAVFSDYDPDRPGINMDGITGDDQAEALGSAVIVVLTNPWPEAIIIGNDYHIVFPEFDGPNDSDPRLIDDPNTPDEPFRMTLPGATIAANSSAAFVWLFSRDVPTSDAWDDIKVGIESPTAYEEAIEVDDSSITPAPDPVTNRVPFFHLTQNPQPRRVLLTYTTNPLSPATNPDLVLDSLRPPVGEVFPRILPASTFVFNTALPDNVPGGFRNLEWFRDQLGYNEMDVTGDTRFMSGAITGRLLATSCISRPAVQRPNSFPANVIEDRTKNNVTNRVDAHGWMYPYDSIDDSSSVQDLYDFPDTIVSGSSIASPNYPDNHLRGIGGAVTFADDLDPYGLGGADLPIFNLFVPNSGLRFTSDTLRIGIYSHTCKDALNSINSLNYWRTASEKLGASLKYHYGDILLNIPNSYLGVLDPTRYVPGYGTGDLLAYADVPDTMCIPLALRVPDCFEASPVRDATNLVQGRVNLNTAPRQVLDVLPLVSPSFAIPAVVSPYEGIPSSSTRAELIEAYRDPEQGDGEFRHYLGTALDRTELPAGLRPDSPAAPGNTLTGVRHSSAGFATPAELAILGAWDTVNGQPIGPQVGTFLEVGADGEHNNFAPIQAWGTTVEPIGVDDPAERLALYRAVSNIATVRSDVFIAWIVIRAYDPQTIERIELPSSNPSIDQVISAMDNPDNGFVPVYESRWMVVLDRSQTESGAPLRLPTDRPRVLMQVELPSIRP